MKNRIVLFSIIAVAALTGSVAGLLIGTGVISNAAIGITVVIFSVAVVIMLAFYQRYIIDRDKEQLLSDYEGTRTRMEALDRTRDEFAANVSHELRTPMTSMKVLADSILAEDEVSPSIYREFMQDIADEIDRENRIITDLLALVRMDNSDSSMNISEVNIGEITETIVKRLRPLARKYEVDLIYEPVDVKAEADEIKIALLITNLLENAIKYNHPGGYAKISISEDGMNYLINVEDNGMGIPEDQKTLIWERFYRVDKSHSRSIGGTGLGLSIAKSVITRHNGRMEVKSEEGKGSTFTVRIPLKYREPVKE
ncbi:MAG: hypothetical protein K6G57_09405 [Lachnospiraceae bacterium]|nr:hypothetical protein [Lachnospiraceae bacterium]